MELFAERAPWYVAGPLIGLLVTGLLWATNRPLGSLGGYIDLLGWLRHPSSGVKSTVFFLAGTVLGGFLSALAENGIGFVRRYSGGPDIDAACGLLASRARGGRAHTPEPALP